jgi:hypothetical protein
VGEETRTGTAVAVAGQGGRDLDVFGSIAGFEAAQRMARALVTSALVPESFRGESNLGNALVALDMAKRVGASPLMVMQNLHVIEGRPSWSSPFVIAALNNCGRYSPLRFVVTSIGKRTIEYERWAGPKGQRQRETGKMEIEDRTCRATATDRASGEILEGPEVSIAMAIREGWYTRQGSKWVTMPDLMLRYRAAAFFGRLYAPEILMGMPSEDEALDVDYRVLPETEAAAATVSPVEPAPAAPTRRQRRSAGLQSVAERGGAAGGKTETPAAAGPVVDVDPSTGAPVSQGGDDGVGDGGGDEPEDDDVI